jgi:hypothetical protein
MVLSTIYFFLVVFRYLLMNNISTLGFKSQDFWQGGGVVVAACV